MTNQTVNWKGQSGSTYQYTVYGINSSWNKRPGNYIFAKVDGQVWRAVYVGQCDDFSNRLPNHEKRACAKKNGATHIHAHVNDNGEEVRKAEEADLVPALQPPCNVLLK